MNSLLRTAMVVTSAVVALTLEAACARSPSEDITDPSFLSPGAKDLVPLTVCVSTDCPAPWATCKGTDGLCTTDTSRDIENCGACGRVCKEPPASFHATSVCSEGTCQLACEELSADCNRREADGCEIDTGIDPKNCGGCGKACKDGDVCWRGACGCPSGFTRCGDECKNLQDDTLSCGSCDTKCTAPPGDSTEWKCGPLIQPPSTGWACSGGGCKITCSANMGNCDGNLCSNGCETDESRDPLNCGACGNKCAPNQDCVDGTCICPEGTTRCGKRCVDVNVDIDNCGACGNACEGAADDAANGSPTCTGGRCGYICYAGFANCDGRLNNGCEVNIGNDPRHCGGCGTKCDSARGQPCVLGQCLTKPCEPGRGAN